MPANVAAPPEGGGMMPDSSQGLFIIVITMPGIIGLFVFSHLYCNRIESSFDKISYIVLLNIMAVIEASVLFDVTLLSRVKYEAISFSQVSEFTLKLMLPLTIFASAT